MILLSCLTELYGLYLAILTLLVTILIGWQIFQAIGFENRIKNQEERIKKDIYADINERTKVMELAFVLHSCQISEILIEMRKFKQAIGLIDYAYKIAENWDAKPYILWLDKLKLKITK